MIVAGLGFRKDATAAEIVAALHAAFAARGLEISALSALAAGGPKHGAPSIRDAALLLGVTVIEVGDDALREAGLRTITRSERSLEAAGVPSLSEAAALAAVGAGGRLLGARTIHGKVTCALAASDTGERTSLRFAAQTNSPQGLEDGVDAFPLTPGERCHAKRDGEGNTAGAFPSGAPA